MEEGREHRLSELQEQLDRGRISRRDFVRLSTALGLSLGAATALASCQKAAPEPTVAPTQAVVAGPTTAPTTAPPAEEPTAVPEPAAEAKANHILVFDPRQCTGCLMCAVACADKWAGEIAPDLAKDTVSLEFSRIRPMRMQQVDVINICHYCTLEQWAEGSTEAPCQAVCPQDAIITVAEGQGQDGLTGMGYKTIDREKCLGLDACGRCLEICEEQFGSGISFDPVERKAQVCTMCGGRPACVEVCPEQGALQFVPLGRNGRCYAYPPEAYAELLYMKMFNKRREL